jgi:hypothetical protein
MKKPDLLHDPGNETPIPALYAVMSIDKGGEGLCGMVRAGIGTPMVTGDPRVAEEVFKPEARRLADLTGKRLVLVKFSRRETLWDSHQ